MGERKVLNKYYPPDFDPSKLAKVSRKKKQQQKMMEMRMMLPMSLCCNMCGNYHYVGTKFNSKKEILPQSEWYLGKIKIHRFYIKCVRCSSQMTFKTDPKNGDYEAENGCSRNFEVWRAQTEADNEAEEAREENVGADRMEELEQRTMDSKNEMELLDALDEMRAQNARHERIDTDSVINALHVKASGVVVRSAEQLAAYDDEAAAAAFGRKRARAADASEDERSEDEEAAAAAARRNRPSSFSAGALAGHLKAGGPPKAKLSVGVKAKPAISVNAKGAKPAPAPTAAGLLGLAYGSSSSDSD